MRAGDDVFLRVVGVSYTDIIQPCVWPVKMQKKISRYPTIAYISKSRNHRVSKINV